MSWDNWRYQDTLLRQLEGKERYRSEHRHRIKRGQVNGSQSMIDRITGEISLLEELLGGGDLQTPEDVLSRLDHLEASSRQFENESVKSGWSMALREERSKLLQQKQDGKLKSPPQ